MAKSNRTEVSWKEQYSSWLKPYVTADGISSDYWCTLCQISVKPKKYNVELHLQTRKHLKNSQIKSECEFQDNGDEIRPNVIKSFQKVEGPDGKLKKILITCAPPTELDEFETINENEAWERDVALQKLAEEVVECFKTDLHNFLRKNSSFVQSIRRNPSFYEGEIGVSRLTRMLVGHVAQDYMMDYTLNSWQSGGLVTRNLMTSRLNSIEQTMHKSVEEVRNIRSQFERMNDFNGQTSIILGGINVEL